MIVIPSIDVSRGRAVKRIRGVEGSEVFADSPERALENLLRRDVKRIHVVDLDGAKAGRPVNLELIVRLVRIAESHGVRTQVGGGIRCLEHALAYGREGADVVLGTLPFTNLEEARRIVRELGSDRVLLSADVMEGRIRVQGWLRDAERNLRDVLEELDVRRAIYTCIDVEGTLQGPRIYESVVSVLREHGVRELIYAGGVGREEDLDHLHAHGFTGVIVGMAFYAGLLDRLLIYARRRFGDDVGQERHR